MGYRGNSSKRNYVDLIDYLPMEKIDPEVSEKLYFILENIKPVTNQ